MGKGMPTHSRINHQLAQAQAADLPKPWAAMAAMLASEAPKRNALQCWAWQHQPRGRGLHLLFCSFHSQSINRASRRFSDTDLPPWTWLSRQAVPCLTNHAAAPLPPSSLGDIPTAATHRCFLNPRARPSAGHVHVLTYLLTWLPSCSTKPPP